MINFFKRQTHRKDPGESYVWLTAMGLSVGLLMIAILIGLVVKEGVSVFWPKPLLQLELTDQKKIAGELRQERRTRTGQKLLEWQLFVANKDHRGFSFQFVGKDSIHSVSYPQDLAKIERREYGPAIGYLRKLVLPNGESLSAKDQKFATALDQELHTIKKRWDQIEYIEKKQIGSINAKIDRLQLEKKSLGISQNSDLVLIEERIESLQSDYSVLALQSRELRQQQKKTRLEFETASGSKRTIFLGQVLDVLYPNQMTLWQKTWQFINNVWSFLIEKPREANTEGGIFPAIFGTFVMTLLMSIAVMPFGIMAAVYLHEYAKQGLFVRLVRISVNNLAGVPSIVFGVFGLGFFVYFVGGTIDQLFFSERLPTPTFGTGGILWASLTLALLTVPIVIVSTEEALSAVPRGLREASLACGASKWQTILRVVLPAGAPGIMTGLILAMARGAGEVAPLMLVGVVKLAPTLPLDTMFPFFHLDRKFMHLGFHIYDLGFQSPDSEAAKPMVFATTLVLILLVILLNLGAIALRAWLRKKYASKAF